MFDNLSERLERSFKLLKGEGKITEINVAETLKDVRRALLDADVNYKVAKTFTDKGYNNKTSLWDDAWAKDQGPEGKVFGFFYSTWGINFTLLGNSLADPDGEKEVGNGIYGDYAVCQGPEPYYWGGTWITAATGTDNPTLVADIMKTMTTNVDVMKEIVTADNDFVNNKPAMEEMAADESYGDAVLGGQNPLAMFCAGADKIDLSNMSIYDQGCNEEFQNAMKNYFEGNATYEEALDLFYKAVVEKYPELSY